MHFLPQPLETTTSLRILNYFGSALFLIDKLLRIWDAPTESLFATGEIPAFKLYESDKVLAFLDIQPLSSGHAVSCFHVFIIPALPLSPMSYYPPVFRCSISMDEFVQQLVILTC